MAAQKRHGGQSSGDARRSADAERPARSEMVGHPAYGGSPDRLLPQVRCQREGPSPAPASPVLSRAA